MASRSSASKGTKRAPCSHIVRSVELLVSRYSISPNSPRVNHRSATCSPMASSPLWRAPARQRVCWLEEGIRADGSSSVAASICAARRSASTSRPPASTSFTSMREMAAELVHELSGGTWTGGLRRPRPRRFPAVSLAMKDQKHTFTLTVETGRVGRRAGERRAPVSTLPHPG